MMRRGTRATLAISVSCGVIACGGGSDSAGGGLAANAVPIIVNAGPAGAAEGYVNGLFASATICVPNDDAHCQTIDGLLLDTGSTGLRILSSLIQLPFVRVKDDGGNDLANCVQFEDGSYFFGPIALADVKLGGELAQSVPVQIIAHPDASEFPKPPDACAAGGMNQGTLDALGANGILGVGFFQQDCGTTCVTDATPGVYFGCTSAGCEPATAPLEKQVSNPVSAFATDNNGVVITLPSVAADGAVAVSGELTFGIGTQKNNATGTAAVLWPDSEGNVTTQFQGQSYRSSAIDSGTNALYFLDATTSGLPICRTNTAFYCPHSTVDLQASLVGDDGFSHPLTFTVANADSLLAKDVYALGDLAGPNSPNVGFLLGIPFFYNRTVFTAIEGRDTSAGVGPYWAY